MNPTATEAQLTALRLAALRPIAYYKGGWYACEPISDAPNQSQHGRTFDTHGDVWVTPNTLCACEDRGWLVENHANGIYAKRWTITDAGRDALAAAERNDR